VSVLGYSLSREVDDESVSETGVVAADRQSLSGQEQSWETPPAAGRGGAGSIRRGAEGSWLAAIWVADRSPMYAPGLSAGERGRSVVQREAGIRLVPGLSAGGVDEFYIRALICSYPWPCSEALAVAWCESRFDPLAINGQHAGLFQIARNWHRAKFGGRDPFDAVANVAVAYAIWLDYGGHWTAWSCKPD